jgi:hypothetical protein
VSELVLGHSQKTALHTNYRKKDQHNFDLFDDFFDRRTGY